MKLALACCYAASLIATQAHAAIFTPLGDFPGKLIDSVGVAVSGDGLTVAGVSWSPGKNEAFRWREDAGMLTIGLLGLAIDALLSRVSSHLLRWHRGLELTR